MTWTRADGKAMEEWKQAWLAAHEHDLPRHLQKEEFRGIVKLTSLAKRVRRKIAHEAWLEMRRQLKAAERAKKSS
jgi:hypothetical protein